MADQRKHSGKLDSNDVEIVSHSTLASYEITATHVPTGVSVSRKYRSTRPGRLNMHKSIMRELTDKVSAES